MTLYGGKASERYFDSWEVADETTRVERARAQLVEYIAYAKRAPFYENRLEAFDPTSKSPLKAIKPLLPSDLRETLPPQGTSLIADNTPYTVFQSGGTTGFPKTTLFTTAELDQLDLPNARGFFALGLSPQDRVGNLFAVGALYMTFVHINRMLQQYGCTNFPFANNTPHEFIHTIVKLFKVNCLTGIASVVLDALRSFERYGLEGIQIDKLFYGGEHLYEADKKEIREKFGTQLIAAPGYGTVDTWYLGYQCLECPTGVFHAHDDQVYLEIVNEETGNACDVGEPGMMYATAFPRRLMPIVRYRVGDRAKWLGERCLCGRTTPLYKLLGRGDDVLRIGYDSIDYAAVQDCVVGIQGLSGTVQIAKERDAGKDRLVVRVETDLLPEQCADKASALEAAILQSRPSLGTFVKKNSVWPLKIELLPPSSIARNPRTGKLIRVVDAIGDH